MLFSLITTFELGFGLPGSTKSKSLRRMAWPRPPLRSLFKIVRLLTLSKIRMAAVDARVDGLLLHVESRIDLGLNAGDLQREALDPLPL